jgi:hypothetical protein
MFLVFVVSEGVQGVGEDEKGMSLVFAVGCHRRFVTWWACLSLVVT